MRPFIYSCFGRNFYTSTYSYLLVPTRTYLRYLYVPKSSHVHVSRVLQDIEAEETEALIKKSGWFCANPFDSMQWQWQRQSGWRVWVRCQGQIQLNTLQWVTRKFSRKVSIQSNRSHPQALLCNIPFQFQTVPFLCPVSVSRLQFDTHSISIHMTP